MKSVRTWGAALTAALLSAFPAIAQQPPMQVPMAPQAIEAQMQQRRTLEQRQAIEAKDTQPSPPVAASAATATDCEAKAVGKSGKPLAGAARAAAIKKCVSGSKGKK